MQEGENSKKMVFIVMFNIILYAILIIWTIKNMYFLERKTKIIYIICSITFIYILTKILYNIGGNPIGKELGEPAAMFNRTMMSIFVGINGLILIPYIGRSLNIYKEQEIHINQLKKRIIIICVIFIMLMIFEFNYMKDIQLNMLGMINNR